MRHDSLSTFLSRGRAALARGPVGLVLVEDAVEVGSTIRHRLPTRHDSGPESGTSLTPLSSRYATNARTRGSTFPVPAGAKSLRENR